MLNSTQLRVAKDYVTVHGYSAQVCRLHNTSSVSIDYSLNSGDAVTVAAGSYETINVTASTSEVRLKRTDGADTAVDVILEWGLTADEAYELASSEVGSDLTALAGLSTTGLVARTGAGTAATRTITGTANQVVVTNGDGVSGNPTLALPQSIATSSTPQFARLGIGVSPSAASLEIDSGTGERPSSITGNGIRMSAPDSTPNSIESCGWGSAPLRIIGRRAGGTRAEPTAVVNGEALLTLEGTGYDGTTHQSSPAAIINLRTNGDWSETNRGTQITFQGTPLNSTTLATWATLANGALCLNAYGAGTLQTDTLGNVTTSSDASLKTVTGSFTRGLDDVLKLTPRTYRWNEKSGMNTEDENVGFIAQEVLGAVPEAVGQYRTTEMEIDGKKTKKREKSELLTLSDRPLIAALVNAVKELKAENDTLRARVSALENEKAAK